MTTIRLTLVANLCYDPHIACNIANTVNTIESDNVLIQSDRPFLLSELEAECAAAWYMLL